MSTLYLTLSIIAFIIVLLLNIFFLYIPLSRIENNLEDIDDKVEAVEKRLEPVIVKLEPVLESFVDSLL